MILYILYKLHLSLCKKALHEFSEAFILWGHTFSVSAKMPVLIFSRFFPSESFPVYEKHGSVILFWITEGKESPLYQKQPFLKESKKIPFMETEKITYETLPYWVLLS